MKRKGFSLILILIFSSLVVHAQKDQLRNKIITLAGTVNGQVGVAIMDLASGNSLLCNVNGIFPMQSVYKFPLALAVLNKVDQKKLSLDQKIKLSKRNLRPNTWSPLARKYPDGNVEVTMQEVLMHTVTYSDNNGCDILFRLLGGPDKVHRYVEGLGVKEMAIVATEEEMHASWNVQFSNWCKPRAMLQLLKMFHDKKLLSPESQELLWKMKVDTITGANRLKGLLPEGTIVAHRTGLGDAYSEGINGALNDVGIVTLPNGKSFAIVVCIARVKGDVKAIENVIATMALSAYESQWLNQ